VRPDLLSECVEDRTGTVAKTLHRGRVPPPLLDAVRHHDHLELKFDSAPIHGTPPAAYAAAIARAVRN